MVKKILITGGAGAIGFHLARDLARQGHLVTIFDNLYRQGGSLDGELKKLFALKNVKFILGDLTKTGDFKKLRGGFDFVYHLAAVNGTRFFYEKPEEVLKFNILAVLNILEWFKNQTRGKILFSSSSETYASTVSFMKGPLPTPEDVILSINDPFNPRFSYAGSKIIGELLFINYARKYQFPYSIVRYHNHYGPKMGFDHVIPEFILRILKRENPFRIYGAQNTRSFCFASDTIRATKLVMNSKKTNSQIIHIGNDSEEIKMVDLAKKLFKIAGYSAKIEILPAPKGSVNRRLPDISKLRKLTGFKPKVDLDQGLKITFDWYLSQRQKGNNAPQKN